MQRNNRKEFLIDRGEGYKPIIQEIIEEYCIMLILFLSGDRGDMQKDNKTIELSALYEISKLLGSSFDMKSNLRGVLRVLSEYLDMSRGTVALRSNNEISIIAAYGMSGEEMKRGRYRLGEGIIGRV
ncbi:MAG: transcriptional regulator, partial [Nitrospirae bacterium]|nr:transcriptional regulator [Nitrospirota bacterium]